MSSRLLVKDKELIKLKEDNKLLIKQIRERKQKKIREIIPQVCYYYYYNSYLLCLHVCNYRIS